MNVLLYIIIATVCFALSSRIYARYISRSLGEDAQNPTPAQICNDGRDYVPTKRYVVFAHHFSAIAGAYLPTAMRSALCGRSLAQRISFWQR